MWWEKLRIKTLQYLNGRKVYRKKFFSEQTIKNIFCFTSGFIIAMMIAALI